jgi:hypothetical protein
MQAPCDFREMTTLQLKSMQPSRAPAHRFRWPLVTLRVLLITFLLALLSFAVCLFLGIMGLLIIAGVRGVHTDMTIAYRQIAFPAALVAGAIALAASITIETRHRDKPA